MRWRLTDGVTFTEWVDTDANANQVQAAFEAAAAGTYEVYGEPGHWWVRHVASGAIAIALLFYVDAVPPVEVKMNVSQAGTFRFWASMDSRHAISALAQSRLRTWIIASQNRQRYTRGSRGERASARSR